MPATAGSNKTIAPQTHSRATAPVATPAPSVLPPESTAPLTRAKARMLAKGFSASRPTASLDDRPASPQAGTPYQPDVHARQEVPAGHMLDARQMPQVGEGKTHGTGHVRNLGHTAEHHGQAAEEVVRAAERAGPAAANVSDQQEPSTNIRPKEQQLPMPDRLQSAHAGDRATAQTSQALSHQDVVDGGAAWHEDTVTVPGPTNSPMNGGESRCNMELCRQQTMQNIQTQQPSSTCGYVPVFPSLASCTLARPPVCWWLFQSPKQPAQPLHQHQRPPSQQHCTKHLFPQLAQMSWCCLQLAESRQARHQGLHI